MKSIQKVTNTAIQLLTYYDKGTNILGKVTNISCNARFTLNIQIYAIVGIIKIFKPTNKIV